MSRIFQEDQLAGLPFRPVRKVYPLRARKLTAQDLRRRGARVKSLEGEVPFQVGDYLARGIQDEEWVVTKEHLDRHYTQTGKADNEGFQYYQAIDTSLACQIKVPFELHKQNGLQLYGKAHDFIVRNKTEAWVVARAIFSQTYRFLDEGEE